jgi:hypothetical protein
LEHFIGTKISIPENMQGNIQGRDTLLSPSEAPMRMIVWFDSLGCSSCQINRMHEWSDIVLYANSIGKVFDPVFIFSPKAADLHTVRIALRTAFFEYPVYIDESHLFPKNNPQIPADNRMHTFLINADNQVVLAGNPLNNEPLWELYKERIRGDSK